MMESLIAAMVGLDGSRLVAKIVMQIIAQMRFQAEAKPSYIGEPWVPKLNSMRGRS